jgi:hypothetical protein
LRCPWAMQTPRAKPTGFGWIWRQWGFVVVGGGVHNGGGGIRACRRGRPG